MQIHRILHNLHAMLDLGLLHDQAELQKLAEAPKLWVAGCGSSRSAPGRSSAPMRGPKPGGPGQFFMTMLAPCTAVALAKPPISPTCTGPNHIRGTRQSAGA